MNNLKSTTLSKTHYECRCCLKPTKSYFKVGKLVENIDNQVQTYQDIWKIITKLEVK